MTTLFLLPSALLEKERIGEFPFLRLLGPATMAFPLPVIQPFATAESRCDCNLTWDDCSNVQICRYKPRKPAAVLTTTVRFAGITIHAIIIIDIIDLVEVLVVRMTAIIKVVLRQKKVSSIIIDVIDRMVFRVRIFAIIIIDVADYTPVKPVAMKCAKDPSLDCLNPAGCTLQGGGGCARG